MKAWVEKVELLLKTQLAAGASAFGVRALGAAVGFLSHIFLARITTPDAYGAYAFAWTIVLLFGTVSAMGLPAAATRFVATYEDQRNRQEITRFRRFSARTISIVAITLAFGLSGFVFIAPTEMLEEVYRPALYVGAFGVPLFALTELGKGIARGFGRNIVAYAPAYVGRPVLLGLGALAFVALGVGVDATRVMLTTVVAMLLAIAWQHIQITRLVRGVEEGGGPSQGTAKLWILTALPLTVMETYNLLLANTDILVLKAFVSPQQIAIYFVGAKVAALLGFVTFAVGAAAGKPIAAAYARGNLDEVRQKSTLFALVATVPTLVGFVGIVLVGRFVLAMFGEAYTAALTPLIILALGVLLQSFAVVAKFCLAMTGGQKGLSAILLFALLLNIALNIALIPQWGVIGAASATAATSLTSTTLLLGLAWRKLGFLPLPTFRR